jgi:hypothetical protein
MASVYFNGSAVVNQFVENFLRREGSIFFGLQSKYPVEVMSKDTYGEIKINFNDHRRRQAIEMKKLDLFRDRFFYKPPVRILSDDLSTGQIKVIGDD